MQSFLCALRSLLFVLWMIVTVIPWALAVLVASLFASPTRIYWMCAGWLKTAVKGGEVILGIRNHIIGWDMTAYGYGAAHPIIPTANDVSTRDIIAIGVITPDGVLWSNYGTGIANPDNMRRTQLSPGDLPDDSAADFSGF